MDITHRVILLEFITSKALNKSAMFLHGQGRRADLFRGFLVIDKKIITMFF